MQTRYKLLHKWGHATFMLKKATQVQSSWLFPVPESETLPLARFPLFLGLAKLCFFITCEEKLCTEKQRPPSPSSTFKVGLTPADRAPVQTRCQLGSFENMPKNLPAQFTRIAWLSVWVSLGSCKPLSSPLPQSDAAVEMWTAQRGEPRLRHGFDVYRDACPSSWRLCTAAAHKQLASAADLQSNHRFFSSSGVSVLSTTPPRWLWEISDWKTSAD